MQHDTESSCIITRKHWLKKREERDGDTVTLLLSLRVSMAHYRQSPSWMHLVLQRQLTKITATADCNNPTSGLPKWCIKKQNELKIHTMMVKRAACEM